MSDAKVRFFTADREPAPPGAEVRVDFVCPRSGYRCGTILIAGKTAVPRDGQNQNGGKAQWDWDGNREAPTFTPSINCTGCWHGFIENGRAVDCAKQDEPEPPPRP